MIRQVKVAGCIQAFGGARAGDGSGVLIATFDHGHRNGIPREGAVPPQRSTCSRHFRKKHIRSPFQSKEFSTQYQDNPHSFFLSA